MGLSDFLRRLRTRPPSGERVELKPLEQVVMARLIDAGRMSSAEIEAIIDERRPVLRPPEGEVAEALVGQGLAERRESGDGAREAEYLPTPKGLRLKGRLPEEPRTVTDFWV